MTRPAIPRPEHALSPGFEKFVELRPGAMPFLAEGRYGHLFAGWRAQLAILIRRLASEVAASRLPLATGATLRDLCASEFDTTLPTAPLAALGDVFLRRPGPLLQAGVIRKGTRWRRPADLGSPYVPKQEAIYESVEDHVVPQGRSSALVRIRAIRPGAHANIVLGPGTVEFAINGNDVEPVEKLFDPTLKPIASMAGGGADGSTDALLRRAATAYAAGRYAPTTGAIVAAALRAGAVHVSAFDMPMRAITGVLIADVSWASSVSWAAAIEHMVLDDFAGFGCRVVVAPTANVFIRVECAITLRRAQDLIDTTEITAALGRALRSYFDARPDWWTWKLSALRGICARAHRRILTCSTVLVRDAATSVPLAEPTFDPRLGHFDGGNRPYHYYLSDNAVQPTYLAPT